MPTNDITRDENDDVSKDLYPYCYLCDREELPTSPTEDELIFPSCCMRRNAACRTCLLQWIHACGKNQRAHTCPFCRFSICKHDWLNIFDDETVVWLEQNRFMICDACGIFNCIRCAEEAEYQLWFDRCLEEGRRDIEDEAGENELLLTNEWLERATTKWMWRRGQKIRKSRGVRKSSKSSTTLRKVSTTKPNARWKRKQDVLSWAQDR
jgi:hypothetical protein